MTWGAYHLSELTDQTDQFQSKNRPLFREFSVIETNAVRRRFDLMTLRKRGSLNRPPLCYMYQNQSTKSEKKQNVYYNYCFYLFIVNHVGDAVD